MRIEPEESVAIIIDIQERLVPVMYKKEAFIENTEILVAGLKELGVPMCLTQQYTRGLGNTIASITEAAGSDQYVEKIHFSAYEEISSFLEAKKFVIICGIEAHICVLQTVIDVKEKGYVPVLVTDCISSRKESDKKVAVKRAQSEGAILTTYESLLFELLKVAGTSTSKHIQRLIK